MHRNRKWLRDPEERMDDEAWETGEVIFQMEPCEFGDMSFLVRLIAQKSGQPITWRVWDGDDETYFEVRTNGDANRVMLTGQSEDMEEIFAIVLRRSRLHMIFQGKLGPPMCIT